VRCRRNKVNVQEILRAYNNNSAERREKALAINRIFPPTKYGVSRWSKPAKEDVKNSQKLSKEGRQALIKS